MDISDKHQKYLADEQGTQNWQGWMAMACNVSLNPQHWILQERSFPFLLRKFNKKNHYFIPNYTPRIPKIPRFFNEFTHMA